MVPPTSRWDTEGRKRDWRVCFMARMPEGAVTTGKEGWEGRRALRRNWEQRRDRWELTGRTCASVWRCPMSDIPTHPVMVQRAAFWRVWSFWILDWEVFENQNEAA